MAVIISGERRLIVCDILHDAKTEVKINYLSMHKIGLYGKLPKTKKSGNRSPGFIVTVHLL